MTGIPAGTKFHGIKASVETINKGSSTANALRDTYTIEEIQGSSIPLSEFHLLDIEALFDALMSGGDIDPEDWKASYTDVIPASGVTLNGQFETDGDFSTETSNWKIVGIVDEGDGAALTSILGSANFQPTDGTVLGGIEISNSSIQYNFDNIQWTYKYEEDPTATGSDPKYLHDFTLSVDSTQINGYIVIGADDSVIADAAEGFFPSISGGGGSCEPRIDFNIGLTTTADPTQLLIGVDTFTGNDFNGALEIKSVEGSTVATSYFGPAQNLDFYMPSADQSASDTYEYVLTLNDNNTGCTYCASSAISGTIVLVLNDPQLSEIADYDVSGMGCGSLAPPPP